MSNGSLCLHHFQIVQRETSLKEWREQRGEMEGEAELFLLFFGRGPDLQSRDFRGRFKLYSTL